MSNFYTSDSHFDHLNIIRYANRPFANVDEMNRILIERWNAVVGQDDDVWHGGDFAMGNQQDAIRRIVPRLNGRIHLIFGNHDKRSVIVDSGLFASTQTEAEFVDGNDRVFIHHYAHRVWPGSHKGTFMLYGHSHSELPPIARSIDIGVDEWDYTPVTMRQIKAKLDAKGLLTTFTPHHGRDHRTQ